MSYLLRTGTLKYASVFNVTGVGMGESNVKIIIRALCGGEYIEECKVWTWIPSIDAKTVGFVVEVSMKQVLEILYKLIGVDEKDIGLELSYLMLTRVTVECR